MTVYHSLCELNYTAETTEAFVDFAAIMDRLAGDLPTPIALRPDQLGLMYLLISSNKHCTLIQLATGAGKSLMLGVIA